MITIKEQLQIEQTEQDNDADNNQTVNDSTKVCGLAYKIYDLIYEHYFRIS